MKRIFEMPERQQEYGQMFDAFASQTSAQSGGRGATRIMSAKVLIAIVAALVVVVGGLSVFVIFPHANQSVQVAQPIQKIIDSYYQLVEQERYEDIYYNYVSAGTRINGVDYSGPLMARPEIRMRAEGYWIEADQGKGKVSSYMITKVSQDHAGYTHVMVNEIRNGKSYPVEFVFVDGKQWILLDIRGI
jgi:uncharacterized membrane protein